jgi:hypothetical protein
MTYESYELGSYNLAGGKAAFYTLHILPEWIACCIIGVLNVRQTLGTGPHGDNRWRDDARRAGEQGEQGERAGEQSVEGDKTPKGMALFF